MEEVNCQMGAAMIHKKHQLILFILLIVLCFFSLSLGFILSWFSKNDASSYINFAHHALIVISVCFAAKVLDFSKLKTLFANK
tara:strand:- start:284 stop:532 length:249 start_codon:yes stop_codon:yes gene_type:complete